MQELKDSTDSDGVIELNYWVESYSPADSAIVWVKVPQIPAGGNKLIYMYYGNPYVASASDGEATFDFFDDFDDDSIDWDKWEENIISGTSRFSEEDGVLVVTHLFHTAALDRLYSKGKIYDGGWACEFNAMETTTGNSFCRGGFVTSTSGVQQVVIGDATSSDPYVYSKTMDAGETETSFGVNTTGSWHKYTIVWISSSKAEFYLDDEFKATHTTNIPSDLPAGFLVDDDSYSSSDTDKYDNFRVRKYTSPEPTTSTGEEELVPDDIWTVRGLNDNTYTVPDENALPENTYYWRVHAVDNAGNSSDWSEVWQFTIADVWVQTEWGGVATYPMLQVGTWDNTYDNWYRHDKVAPNAENIVGPRTGSGYLESSVYDAGAIVDWQMVEFETAGVGTAKVYLRFDNDNDPTDKEWIQVANGASLNIQARYVQYKVELTGAWAIPYDWPTTQVLSPTYDLVTVEPQKTFKEIRIHYTPTS